ncbi:NAD(P)H-binding protein [Flavobacterium sp. H122]|uniref:NAD(P)H-binding protein n=1 Tax=Flavobacterium sp. H122 TaxID=2529860 RepID=UPI0010AA2C31|nr:NAD(P)H-binding protein [Flavobacterium sp. H122]
MVKTAIIIGATGLTGNILLQKLLRDDTSETIKVFSRKPVNINHPKIKEYPVDLLQLENYKNEFTGDVVYCCIGTTKKQTPDENQYKAIDYGIPVNAAKLARQNNIKIFIVISALGADVNSSIFYNRTKGEMERDVLAQKIEQTYILQPSLIDYVRNERLGERIAVYFMRILNFLLVGSLKKYQSITPEQIAEAMLQLTKRKFNFDRIESHQIKQIANKEI